MQAFLRSKTAHDGNGNVMALVSATDRSILAQYEYGPFGEVLRATVGVVRLRHELLPGALDLDILLRTVDVVGRVVLYLALEPDPSGGAVLRAIGISCGAA